MRDKQINYLRIMGTKIGFFLSGLLAGILLMVAIRDANEPVPVIPKTNTSRNTTGTVDTLIVTQRDTIVQPVYIEVAPSDTEMAITDSSALPDSSFSDSVLIIAADSLETPNSDFSTIEEEELLFSKILVVQEKKTEKDSSKVVVDSLLEKQTGINRSSTTLNLEFWEHPFYKTGYVKNGKVIRLYGVVPDEQATLKALNKQLYLSLNGSFYSVENTFNLLPLISETDSLVLLQLIAH